MKKNSWLKIFFISLTCLFAFASSSFAAPEKKSHVKHHLRKHVQKNTHRRLVKKKHLAAKKIRLMIPNREPADEEDLHAALEAKVNAAHESDGFVASVEERVVSFVHQTVGTLRYSVYKLGASHVDITRGIYILDCSSYVDYILKNIYPQAFSRLVSYSGTEKPTTTNYYSFFNDLNDDVEKKYWNKINDVEDLRPGDVLVLRYTNARGYETGGHVMIVMDKPSVEDDAYLIRVADSAAGGHSQDTRRKRASGIGIGTIVLKVDPHTYQPQAFAWRIGARLNRNVNVAMARPIDINQGASDNSHYLHLF